MNRKIFAALGIAAYVVMMAPAAMAGGQDFTLHNRAGFTIKEVYVEPESNKDDWGDEMLKGDSLKDGQDQDLDFSGYGNANDFGILAVDADGKDHIWHHVKLTEITDVTIYKDDDGNVHWKSANKDE